MYNLSLVTAPTVEPLTAAEAKSFLRIDSSDEDTYIGNLIVAARMLCESYTNRAFIRQTWDIWLDYCDIVKSSARWTAGYYEVPVNYFDTEVPLLQVPKAPLYSVTYIKSYDTAGTETTFDSSNYVVNTYAGEQAPKGSVTLAYGAVWPAPLRSTKSMVVRAVLGYGTAGTDVPFALRQAILMQASAMYNDRGDCRNETTAGTLSKTSRALLNPFRLSLL